MIFIHPFHDNFNNNLVFLSSYWLKIMDKYIFETEFVNSSKKKKKTEFVKARSYPRRIKENHYLFVIN